MINKIALLILLVSISSVASEIVLSWDDTNAPGVVRSFNLYRYSGTNRIRIASTNNAGARELSDTNFNRTVTNTYSVTASNSLGESESPKLTLLPLLAPFALANRYSSRRWTLPINAWLQRSRDLVTWENHIQNVTDGPIIILVKERAEFPTEFFRVNTNVSIATPPLPGGVQ